jgi:predicted RNase H-like nuclease (RuvC/YqgF family)
MMFSQTIHFFCLHREDLLSEIQDLKKKVIYCEEIISGLKSENQRLEMEGIKQQRRVEQLLHLSEGAKGTAQNVRKEIEKSILVRQLKVQVSALRNLLADKDLEIDSLRRDIRTSHVKVRRYIWCSI